MKIQLIALSLCVLASTNLVKGQEHSKGFTPSENKHEIRLSVSDGLTQGSVDILGMGLADAVTGSKRTDENYSLVYGFGYRYSLGRFKVGTDLGFSTSNSKLALAGEQAPSLKESNVNFLILPAAEFVYYKRIPTVEIRRTETTGLVRKTRACQDQLSDTYGCDQRQHRHPA